MTRCIVLLALLAATPAHAYISDESYMVRGDAQRFIVEYEPGSAARQYWCAAGEFIDDYLAMLPTTKIYRLSPRPLQRGEGMIFSISPEGAVEETGVAIFPANNYMTAGFAESLCDSNFPRRR